MASKNDMYHTMQNVFEKYRDEFNESKITNIEYYNWVSSLKLYDDLRKAHNFILKKFLFQLQLIKKVLSQHPKHAWPALKQFDRVNVQVRMLKLLVKETRIIWKKRPKQKRARVTG